MVLWVLEDVCCVCLKLRMSIMCFCSVVSSGWFDRLWNPFSTIKMAGEDLTTGNVSIIGCSRGLSINPFLSLSCGKFGMSETVGFLITPSTLIFMYVVDFVVFSRIMHHINWYRGTNLFNLWMLLKIFRFFLRSCQRWCLRCSDDPKF